MPTILTTRLDFTSTWGYNDLAGRKKKEKIDTGDSTRVHFHVYWISVIRSVFGMVFYFRLYSKGPSSPVGEEFPGVSSVPWVSVEEFLVAFLMWTV